MKRPPVILAAILSIGIGAFADDAFDQAQTAYDDGRYAEAALLYEGMLGNGVANIEIHYNLANACFKDGDLPKAAWHYRKAWYQAPRDPDIRANLHFALNAAGAIDPAPRLIERIFTTLSTSEWIATAVCGYLLLAALLLPALLVRKARPFMLKLCLLPAAILLLAAGGWWQWRQFVNSPECVVVKSGTTALYGPVEGGTAYYKLPLGALVRQRGTNAKGWLEVEYDGKNGWIKKGNIAPLYP